ncbi:hypothetical protein HUU53_02875 [Candidatus Micrarchaeota archaeon]|nr:hypothetical protein [Candidatus Micrarchaeota archaeon]
MLTERGFFVVRASGSGVDGVSPDLIALHTTKKFALECKARKDSLHFEKIKIEVMRGWEQTTGLPIYVAWKLPYKQWRFFPLSFLKETEKGYSLSKLEEETGMTLEELLK